MSTGRLVSDMKGLDANAKLAVAFSAGALIGAGCSFLVAKRLLEAKAEQRITSEVDETKKYYKARMDELKRAQAAAIANAVAKSHNPLDGETPVGDDRGVAEGKPERRSEGRTDYQQAALDAIRDDADAGDVPGWAVGHPPLDQVSSDATGRKDPMAGLPSEDSDDEDDEDDAADAVLDQTIPFVISADEFIEDEEHFTKATVTWYAGDGALIDEDETPIRNPLELLGTGFSGQFGNKSDDDRIVYIRNRSLQVDFEVKLHDGSYVEEVLNYGRPK